MKSHGYYSKLHVLTPLQRNIPNFLLPKCLVGVWLVFLGFPMKHFKGFFFTLTLDFLLIFFFNLKSLIFELFKLICNASFFQVFFFHFPLWSSWTFFPKFLVIFKLFFQIFKICVKEGPHFVKEVCVYLYVTFYDIWELCILQIKGAWFSFEGAFTKDVCVTIFVCNFG